MLKITSVLSMERQDISKTGIEARIICFNGSKEAIEGEEPNWEKKLLLHCVFFYHN